MTPEIDDFRDFVNLSSGDDFLHFLQKFGIPGFFAIFRIFRIFPDFYKIRDRGFLQIWPGCPGLAQKSATSCHIFLDLSTKIFLWIAQLCFVGSRRLH